MAELAPSPLGPPGDGLPAEAGVTLLDALVGTVLLIVGTLGMMTLVTSCANLQRQIREMNAAHFAACDLIEQMRASGPTAAHTQFTATPTTTVQGLQATVSFPEDVGTGNFGDTMVNSAALAKGFVPVRITIASTTRQFVFTTFLGSQ